MDVAKLRALALASVVLSAAAATMPARAQQGGAAPAAR